MVRIDGMPPVDLEWAGWSYDRELATQTLEMLDAVRIQAAGLTGDKKVKRWKPTRLPRPFEKPRPRGSWVDMLRTLARQKRR